MKTSKMFGNGIIVATIVVAAAVIFIFLWIKRSATKDGDTQYPPSSSVLSLIAAILREGMRIMPEHFMRSAEKLGPVISYNFGGRRVVILNGKEAITEAFLRQSETFADRPLFWTETNILNPNLRGIIFARYTDTYKKYHKLSLAILKEFGFGVHSVSETRILREVESLKDKVLKFNGRPFDPKSFLVESTFSVVSSILFGEAFVRSGSALRMAEAIGEYVRNMGFALEFAPWLRHLPYFNRFIPTMISCQQNMFTLIEEGIDRCKSDERESTFVRRFIEMQGPNYDRQDLLYILRDLCMASADTVSSTLLWTTVTLANHPEVQIRLQKEIDDVIPNDRLPSLDDKPRLPYTEAVILEVMRRPTFAPLYTPHATLKDAEVLGCHIPKGCTVLANAFSVHMDPKYWKDPKNFRPERFLDEENRIAGSENVIPFSIGRRSCLGEILGRQKIFLFLTSLIQHFDIRPPEGQNAIEVKEVIGFGVFPSEFQARLIPRIKIGD